MFGIGFWETIIIIIVIILMVKPEEIPQFMRTVGRIIGEIRKIYEDFIFYIKSLEYKVQDGIDFEEKKTDKNKKKKKSSNVKKTKRKSYKSSDRGK